MKVLKPSDFFCGVSLEMVRKAFKLMPVRTIMALVLYYVMASFMFVINHPLCFLKNPLFNFTSLKIQIFLSLHITDSTLQTFLPHH